MVFVVPFFAAFCLASCIFDVPVLNSGVTHLKIALKIKWGNSKLPRVRRKVIGDEKLSDIVALRGLSAHDCVGPTMRQREIRARRGTGNPWHLPHAMAPL